MEPNSPSRSLLFEVWMVANSTRSLLDETLLPSGLDADEFALYSVLRQGAGITPTELATLMSIPATTVSSIVARLERRRHARRTPNPEDARSYRIQLTPTGQRAHSGAAKLFLPVLAAIEAALTLPVAEARSALAAIDSAARAVKEYQQR